ncbi:hypothetical protein [Mycolicibacterium grossiae]|uniref:hypothetical protein n=1 Tax=Mycolicibacterium grossiae TaxID=1552759 RepID=UPI0011F0EF8E|nr:hypothetical protein FZ046_05670 [Mycolicibacterium grossiae]
MIVQKGRRGLRVRHPSLLPAVPTGAGGAGVHAASTGKTDAAVGAAPVPVSAARLERDAIASAASGGAGRKGTTGNTALILARRIAAALNIGVSDFGFYWVTGLTTDGAIVVANSYGLGYIPDGVRLPPQVAMATADETVTPADRATWATYPILAIQGWARAHGHTLRAVIATEEQFASFDPGAAKIDGRSRDDVHPHGERLQALPSPQPWSHDTTSECPSPRVSSADRLIALLVARTKIQRREPGASVADRSSQIAAFHVSNCVVCWSGPAR